MNAHTAENDAHDPGWFYAYDAPALDRAVAHGCLDEDIDTGDPIVCGGCVTSPRSGAVVRAIVVEAACTAAVSLAGVLLVWGWWS